MGELSFGVGSTRDLLVMLLEDYEDFKRDTTSSKCAIRCAMTSWHLADWSYKEFSATLALQYPTIKNYQNRLKTLCPDLEIMQDIANGSKHNQITLYQPKVERTEIHKGAFSSGFSRDFDTSSLDVHMKDGSKIYFEDIIEPVVTFWKNYLVDELGVQL